MSAIGAQHITIGIAGHIDHGKTALTKALSGVDTDTLKEEKERGITIEPGIAHFYLGDGIQSVIIDVPGHERFIRQMIAGSAGIDMVILVIAADEGIMPQTVEHLEILQFLGITDLVCAVSKADKVNEEWKSLLLEEIVEMMKSFSFLNHSVHFVDSFSGTGLEELKLELLGMAENVTAKNVCGPFRLPIDHSFTVAGQGTVVRGTILEGSASVGDTLQMEPGGDIVKVRQLQIHNRQVDYALAGQRAALNVTGIKHEDVKRGHVLFSPGEYQVSDTLDIMLLLTKNHKKIKQRQLIKFYIGTTEIMGKIVFFDRNESTEKAGAAYCQVRLVHPVIAKRGDRFILRRPSPEETIGGGEVIDPNGGKYRFGEETVAFLKEKKEGAPEEWIIRHLQSHHLLHVDEMAKLTGIPAVLSGHLQRLLAEKHIVEVSSEQYALSESVSEIKNRIVEEAARFHQLYPLREGLDKAELLQRLKGYPVLLIEYVLKELLHEAALRQNQNLIAQSNFQPEIPNQWKVRYQQLEQRLFQQGIESDPFDQLYEQAGLPKGMRLDILSYLRRTGQAVQAGGDRLIHSKALDLHMKTLKESCAPSFSIQEAKTALKVSRKFLIPFLELLDQLGYTERAGDHRRWNKA
ncbi:selenocysteine-specific translation elongation factor SelB [Bacillus sp. OV194]|nr:selenocysteine-specific translation elongation factor SelB [Bacillus sp. OV194]